MSEWMDDNTNEWMNDNTIGLTSFCFIVNFCGVIYSGCNRVTNTFSLGFSVSAYKCVFSLCFL